VETAGIGALGNSYVTIPVAALFYEYNDSTGSSKW
jgi:hypothetical protein